MRVSMSKLFWRCTGLVFQSFLGMRFLVWSSHALDFVVVVCRVLLMLG
jgi:hypothetical protein